MNHLSQWHIRSKPSIQLIQQLKVKSWLYELHCPYYLVTGSENIVGAGRSNIRMCDHYDHSWGEDDQKCNCNKNIVSGSHCRHGYTFTIQVFFLLFFLFFLGGGVTIQVFWQTTTATPASHHHSMPHSSPEIQLFLNFAHIMTIHYFTHTKQLHKPCWALNFIHLKV